MRPRVIVYAKANCGCAASAIATLRANGIEPHVEALEDHADLQAQHPNQSPLVAIDGQVKFRGEVSAVLLRRLLGQQQQQQQQQ